MDISAVVLHKLLVTKDLETWSKLKLSFLDSAYASVYAAIARHYDTYSTLPSFEELDVTLRASETKRTLEALKLAEVPEVDIEVALDALIDSYTQNETIKLLDKYIDEIPVYNTEEVKSNLANIVMLLDERTLTTEGVFDMQNINIFEQQELTLHNRIAMGINNTCDATIGGVAREELILIGGKRGSGKSITALNLACNQYEIGNTSVFYTIEMSAKETFGRAMAILTGVNYQNIKQNKLSADEVLKIVRCRADMFVDAEEVVQDFLKHKDRFKFEDTLRKSKNLKPDNQLIIVDDRSLKLSSIDLHMSKFKSKFGDKMTMSVIDYVNKVQIEGANRFDWQPQIVVSEKLKEYARKYDQVVTSPYQIDDGGEARFAKGILDAADIAFIMKPHPKEDMAISFETTKIRGASEMVFTSGMDWNCLKISPFDKEAPGKEDKIKKVKSKKVEEDQGDLPWNT